MQQPTDAAMGSRSPLQRPCALLVSGVVLVALGWDLTRQPQDQWTAWILLRAIESYQTAVSPSLAEAGVKCRFEPTCSRYAASAISKYGTLSGSWRAGRRLVKCGPWTAAGTVDPP